MATARSMATREYILECDRELPPEQQTKFLIKPLSGKLEAEIGDLISSDKSAYVEYIDNGKGVRTPVPAGHAERRYRMLSECLVGWSNYKDEAGNEIKFESLTPDERLSALYPEWRDELASFCDSINIPSEGSLKN